MKQAGSTLAVVTAPIDKDGIIDFDIYKKNMDKVRQLAQAGKILAADAIGRGGLYMTLVKMAVGNKIGADVKIDGDVLAPQFGSIVLELSNGEDADKLLEGSAYQIIG